MKKVHFCSIVYDRLTDADIMSKEYHLPFKIGQSAEARSFQKGFRGAWFRCKIKKICRKTSLVEFFDYPDEKLRWTQFHQRPPYQNEKSKEKKQLMLRPQYPLVKLKNEGSDASSLSEAVIVVDRNWKVGDLVDWWANGCYWSGHLTKLLGNDKAEMELTPPPMGEGEIYEVSFKDLRPSLDWTPNFGWTVPASQDGESIRRCAQLIQSVNQAVGRFPDLKIHSMSEVGMESPTTVRLSSDVSFSNHLSGNSIPASDEKRDFKTSELVERQIIDHPNGAASSSKKVRLSDIGSGSVMGDDSAKETSWSDDDSSSSIGLNARSAGPTENRPLKRFKTSGVQFHSMSSDSMEAAIFDMEELANKINWLKGIIEFGRPLSNADRPSWKFVEHRASS